MWGEARVVDFGMWILLLYFYPLFLKSRQKEFDWSSIRCWSPLREEHKARRGVYMYAKKGEKGFTQMSRGKAVAIRFELFFTSLTYALTWSCSLTNILTYPYIICLLIRYLQSQSHKRRSHDRSTASSTPSLPAKSQSPACPSSSSRHLASGTGIS